MILIGRLGKDPEIKATTGGKTVANFSMATDETYTDKNGDRQKRTTWHNIVVWGPLAEQVVGKYLSKGSLIYCEGKTQKRSYEAKDGTAREVVEVNVETIRMLDTQKENHQPRGKDISDDDIPF